MSLMAIKCKRKPTEEQPEVRTINFLANLSMEILLKHINT